MTRRKPYTKVERVNQIRPDYIKGMGDVIFKGFKCLNSECRQYIFIRKDELIEDIEITCPNCNYVMRNGEETKFFDYTLKSKKDNSIIEKGEFSILHDDYIAESKEYKYCIICYAIKPLEFFDHHDSRNSGRQGECRLCKKVYNTIKNQTRLSDQHREAAQKRRLYLDLAGGQKIDSKEIIKRFEYKCFKCGKELSNAAQKEWHLDHTLPAYYLWPLTTTNATLLCQEHNTEKAGKWPLEYYTMEELKGLSVKTGIQYKILTGQPQYNPDAVKRLKDPKYVEQLIIKYIRYEAEISKLRNRILSDIGFDFFKDANISPDIVERANTELIIKKDESKIKLNTDET